MEDWKFVVDNDNYIISDLGRIMNVKTGRYLKPIENSGGTLQVTLSRNGRQAKEGVHNLVARAYLEDIPNYAIRVKHRNGNKQDNRPENLYWE